MFISLMPTGLISLLQSGVILPNWKPWLMVCKMCLLSGSKPLWFQSIFRVSVLPTPFGTP